MNSRQNKVLNRSHGPRLNVRNELLFQPWFLPKRITYKIHGLMPPQYWKKMRYYFEDWGVHRLWDRGSVSLEWDVCSLFRKDIGKIEAKYPASL